MNRPTRAVRPPGLTALNLFTPVALTGSQRALLEVSRPAERGPGRPWQALPALRAAGLQAAAARGNHGGPKVIDVPSLGRRWLAR
ncbi:hypothetical protein ACQP1W_10950 [Spirillospora sp. CA-255316]